jgi:hypothetical protein
MNTTDLQTLRGLELRYALTVQLLEAGHDLSVSGLEAGLAAHGFVPVGRAGKTISDALRWEIRRGRVIRMGPDRYRTGYIPRQTKSRIRRRVLARRLQAAQAAELVGSAPPASG